MRKDGLFLQQIPVWSILGSLAFIPEDEIGEIDDVNHIPNYTAECS